MFDEIWEPETGNSSIRLDLLRALTKAGNYVSGAFDSASGELLGACVGFFGPPPTPNCTATSPVWRPPACGGRWGSR